MLEELWYRESLIHCADRGRLISHSAFLFKDPPRVIIALARHRNEVSVTEGQKVELR